MIALQRLAYGRLRLIEIEQIYEKAWFAITETCLAMTIFREEVGGWFLIMFLSLLIGKVWGWLGEGRLEILEQQPPNNPRLFHLRLSSSLALSVLFNTVMLRYSIQTIREQAQPNMMVMFAFEFAVLSVTSLSSAARYAIYIHEQAVIKRQTRLRRQEWLANNQHQAPAGRERSSPTDAAASPVNPSLNVNDGIEEEEYDVPGWETKGFWVFYVDLLTGTTLLQTPRISPNIVLADFLKLVLYLSFFGVLCIFYGMPLHIIRDVAITIRSFYKRIHDFLRYRQAAKDMNERYPDATREEIAREDVCIICRETMREWNDEADRVAARQPSFRQQDQRLRPKKLPCGHILHFACLRSWLERQQNCPTCRRPVLNTTSLIRVSHARAQDRQIPQPDPPPREGFAPVINGVHPQPQQNRVRFFNFGPIRLGFGAGQDLRGLADYMNRNERELPPSQPQPANNALQDSREVQHGIDVASDHVSTDSIQRQLQAIERQLMQQLQSLRVQADQLYLVRTLQGELARIRMANPSGSIGRTSSEGSSGMDGQDSWFQSLGVALTNHHPGEIPQNLPRGLAIPDGWTLLPLRRVPEGPVGSANSPATDARNPPTGPSLRTSQPSPSSQPNVSPGSEASTPRSISAPFSRFHTQSRSAPSATGSVNSIEQLEKKLDSEDLSSPTQICQDSLRSNAPQIGPSSTAADLSPRGISGGKTYRSSSPGNLRAPDSGNGAGSKHVMIEDQDDDDST